MPRNMESPVARATVDRLKSDVLKHLAANGEATRVALMDATRCGCAHYMGTALQELIDAAAVSFRLMTRGDGFHGRGCGPRRYRLARASAPAQETRAAVEPSVRRVAIIGECAGCTCTPHCGTDGFGRTVVVTCGRRRAA